MPEIQVLIDVVEQGYTGQRDGWETRTHTGTVVTLEDDGTVQFLFPDSSQQRRILFERAELDAAIELLERAKA